MENYVEFVFNYWELLETIQNIRKIDVERIEVQAGT